MESIEGAPEGAVVMGRGGGGKKNRKGSNAENEVKRHLEREGYTVHRAIRAPFMGAGGFGSNSNDIFGCADLCAVKADDRVRFIQVTAGNNDGAKVAELSAIPWPHHHCSVELWRRMKEPGDRSGVIPYRVRHGQHGFSIDLATWVEVLP